MPTSCRSSVSIQYRCRLAPLVQEAMCPPLMRFDAFNRLLYLIPDTRVRPGCSTLSRDSVTPCILLSQSLAIMHQNLRAINCNVESIALAIVRWTISIHDHIGDCNAGCRFLDSDVVVEAGEIEITDPRVRRPRSNADSSMVAGCVIQDATGACGVHSHAQVFDTYFRGLRWRSIRCKLDG